MLTTDELQEVLAALRRARDLEAPRLAQIKAYVANKVCDIYVPRDATDEYRMLVDQARFNILPTVVRFDTQDLFVSGYRATGPNGRAPSPDNSPVWDLAWQPNRMDSRQRQVHRAAVTYGTGYTSVLKGKAGAGDTPVISTWSPLRMTCLYKDEVNDEWPVYAMSVAQPDTLTRGRGLLDDPTVSDVVAKARGDDRARWPMVRIYDATHVYDLVLHPRDRRAAGELVAVAEHGLGVCPVVRFHDPDEDGCSVGRVEPILPVQRQINQTTFGLLMTQQFQAFRQRWATGMAIERDDNGNVIPPWNAAVNAVWQNESPDAKFGDFAETSLDGYLTSRDKALLFVSSTSQIPPHNMVVGNAIANISAEALTALQSAHDHNVADTQVSFGESWEQTLRLAGLAMGDQVTYTDTSAQVVWADRTPRSMAQIADALGKLATLLEIPPDALWERIPGVTDQDIALWREMRAERNPMAELAAMMGQPVAGERPAPEPAAEPVEV